MSERKEINPFVKSALEYGPILLFFIAYLRLKDRVFTIGARNTKALSSSLPPSSRCWCLPRARCGR